MILYATCAFIRSMVCEIFCKIGRYVHSFQTTIWCRTNSQPQKKKEYFSSIELIYNNDKICAVKVLLDGADIA